MTRGDFKVGWAVSDGDGIDLKTVSDTRRAAIVNWLCVKDGRIVSNVTTDQQIERMWGRACDIRQAIAIQVRISPHQ